MVHDSVARLFFGLLTSLFLLASLSQAQQTITFASGDGLELTADVYLISEEASTPFIVLFHQANASRGEYIEIAPKLNDLGFNALALDQRSVAPESITSDG